MSKRATIAALREELEGTFGTAEYNANFLTEQHTRFNNEYLLDDDSQERYDRARERLQNAIESYIKAACTAAGKAYGK